MKKLLALLLVGAACGRPAESIPGKIVVRSASVRALVERLDGVDGSVRSRVEALGGFITNSELSESALTVVFRVPSEKLELAVSELSKLATRVDSRQVRGEDLTEEYVDLEAQRTNLTATRDRLLVLLDKATKVDDALEVNKGLTEVQGQLEHLVGRMKYLQQAAALSTVTVTFYPESNTAVMDASGWRPLEVARVSLRGLVMLLQALGNLAIALAVFAPLWVPAWWLLRRGRRTARTV